MYKTVLLPIDLNEASSWDRALPAALNAVRDNGAQLVMASHRPELWHYLLGPNAVRATRRTPCSWCVRALPNYPDLTLFGFAVPANIVRSRKTSADAR